MNLRVCYDVSMWSDHHGWNLYDVDILRSKVREHRDDIRAIELVVSQFRGDHDSGTRTIERLHRYDVTREFLNG